MGDTLPPVLSISGLNNTLVFQLQDGFVDSYTNTLDLSEPSCNFPHPLTFKYKGGKFDPLQIELDLFVGVGSQVGNPK